VALRLLLGAIEVAALPVSVFLVFLVFITNENYHVRKVISESKEMWNGTHHGVNLQEPGDHCENNHEHSSCRSGQASSRWISTM